MWLSDYTGVIIGKDKWHYSPVSSVWFCVNYFLQSKYQRAHTKSWGKAEILINQ